MSKKQGITISYMGIVVTIIYFIVVAAYFVTESSLIFRCWEAMIILSAPMCLLILIVILENAGKDKNIFKTAAIAFMICTTVITSSDHFSHIISRNEIIADFRANDPLAWGFFMGLAFIFTSLSLAVENTKLKKIKITAMVCGCLCLLGLLGPILDITSIWFIAVAGYGIGTPVICVMLLEFIKNQN